ncbi:MAG: PDZ domain-containing protein, partial [Mucinivorans sp.]
NMILVKTIVNDADTVVFNFDTGAPVGGVLSDSLAKRYKDIRQLKIAFANGKDIKYSNIDSTKILVDFITHNVDNNLQLLGIRNASKYRYWSINYDDLIFQILPKESVIDTTDALVFDFEMSMNGICMIIPIAMHREGKYFNQNLKLMLDTGCPFAFLMSEPSNELQKFVESIDYFDLQRLQPKELKNSRDSRFFTLDSISFSGCIIKDIHSVFNYTISFDKYLKNGTTGLLGMEIMKHFNTIIDFDRKKVILKSHKKTFNYELAIFTNALGFQVRNKDKVVTSIERGHNAQKAGLKLGDMVIRINELNLANLTHSNLDSLRLLKGGHKMKVGILRDGKQSNVEFTTKTTLKQL